MAERGKRTIVEEIRLTGAPEIEAQFAAMGEAGVKAFAELKKAAESAGNTTALSKFVNQTKKDFAALQTKAKEVGKTYKELGSATKEAGLHILELSAVVIEAGVALFEFAKKGAEAADAQERAAQAAGLSVEEYGKLQFAFGQSEVSADSFGVAMKRFNVNLVAAQKGTGPAAAAFKSLGISVTDANGQLLPTDEILQKLSDAFQKLPDGPRKAALAVTLFGKSGTDMIPALNEGSKAMAAFEAQATKLGLVFTKQEAIIGKDFVQSLNALQKQIVATSEHLGLLFAPSFTETFKSVSDIIAQNKDAIIAFGQSLANQVGPLLKDFVSILKGDDAAVVNKNLLSVRDTIVSIGQALGIVASLFNAAFGALTDLVAPLVDVFNNIFGTHFTAQAVVITGIIFALTGVFKVFSLGIKAATGTWELLVLAFKGNAGIVAAAITFIIGIIAEVDILIHQVIDTVAAWGVAFSDFGTTVQTGLTALGKFILDIWTGLTTNTDTLFSDLGKAIIGAFQSVFDFISDKVNAAIGLIKSVIDFAAKAAAAVASALGGGGGDKKDSGSGGGGFAGGGRVRGAGTSTSDSIIARLSDGEFVVRAAAVRRYGTAFMSAVNGMRLPKALGFAQGGPVSAPRLVMPALPAFASGGPVGRPLALTIGGDLFEGLIAPETVANKLVRYAQGRTVRAAGRRPSWSN